VPLLLIKSNANLWNQAREGPVQFEKDTGDVFNVDAFLTQVGESSNKREYGLQEGDERSTKRARVDEDVD
jgi:SNW domain-containing protein 1